MVKLILVLLILIALIIFVIALKKFIWVVLVLAAMACVTLIIVKLLGRKKKIQITHENVSEDDKLVLKKTNYFDKE